MTHKVFSVYDSKAEAFTQPFFAHTRGIAQRMFRAACQDPNHDFHKFADDYTLFELGEFDDSSAEFHSHEAPISLGLALSQLNPEVTENVNS